MDRKSKATFAWLQDRATTPDGVYRVLRAAILDGTVPPGSQLREAQIATDLGISRSPLREALMKLDEEDLIVRVPYRGAFVAEISTKDVAEITSLRLRVEPYAAELSLPALRGPERRTLTKTTEKLRRTIDKKDIPGSIDVHLQFHRLFYELSGNSALRNLWLGWENKMRLYYMVDTSSYGDLNELAVAHERLAVVALEGDIDGFEHELAQHFRAALRGEIEPKENTPGAAV